MATAAETAAKSAIKDTAEASAKIADKMKLTSDEFAGAGAKAFKDGVEKSLAGLNEAAAQSKQNMDALVASAAAAAQGAEALSAQVAAYGKCALEKHVETAKALSSARSVQEVMELQTAYAKSSVETYVAEMGRASETFAAMLKDAFRPINARVTSAVETLQASR
jgi:phasin family protein